MDKRFLLLILVLASFLVLSVNEIKSVNAANETNQTCTEGWKCYNMNTRGYQLSNCSWNSLLQLCDYGCSNGICLTAPTNQTCSDGTLYGQCSTSKPRYCNNGTIINNCQNCGCSVGTCQTDGSCKTTLGKPPKMFQSPGSTTYIIVGIIGIIILAIIVFYLTKHRKK